MIAKYFSILPNLLIVSSFGVYLAYGLRVEHLVLYPSAILFFLIALLSKKLIIKDLFLLFVFWVIVLIFALIVTFLGGNNVSFFSGLADIESFIQPLFIMILFMFNTDSQSTKDISKKISSVCKVLLIMLSLNSIFIFIGMVVDVSQIGEFFWGNTDGQSVAFNAAGNGRFSGIFNQPMESGVMYSIGLLAWIYLSEKQSTFNIKYILILFLILIGGIISVSKIFLFGGISLFLLGMLLNKKRVRMFYLITIWTTIFGIIAYYFLLKTWTGLGYLLRFFGSNENLLSLLTSGRFGGNNSQQRRFFGEIWEDSPLYGKGFGVTEIYDSGYFQFFAISGSIGLIILIILLFALSLKSLSFLKLNKFNTESKLFFLLLILITGSLLGSPTFTLNRVSIVLWIFIGLLYQYHSKEKLLLIATSKNQVAYQS